MAAETTEVELTQTMEHVSAVLPGLGEPVPVRLPPTSPAVGHTLAELRLRGLTGATVLSISHVEATEGPTLVPTGKERLHAGDVLALAGPHEAVESARAILDPGAETGSPGAPGADAAPL